MGTDDDLIINADDSIPVPLEWGKYLQELEDARDVYTNNFIVIATRFKEQMGWDDEKTTAFLRQQGF